VVAELSQASHDSGHQPVHLRDQVRSGETYTAWNGAVRTELQLGNVVHRNERYSHQFNGESGAGLNCTQPVNENCIAEVILAVRQ